VGAKAQGTRVCVQCCKSSQIDVCVLDWPKRHRPPSIISEGRKGDSFVLRKNRAKFASNRKSFDRTDGAIRSPSATECATRSLRDTGQDRPAAAGHGGIKRTPRQVPRSVPLPDGSCYCLQRLREGSMPDKGPRVFLDYSARRSLRPGRVCGEL
jgi:hypothetical protein